MQIHISIYLCIPNTYNYIFTYLHISNIIQIKLIKLFLFYQSIFKDMNLSICLLLTALLFYLFVPVWTTIQVCQIRICCWNQVDPVWFSETSFSKLISYLWDNLGLLIEKRDSGLYSLRIISFPKRNSSLLMLIP